MTAFDWPASDAEEEDDPLERALLNLETWRDIGEEQLGRRQAQARVAAADPSTLDKVWQPLGPSTALDQKNKSRRNGGRVVDLQVSDDGQRVYLAAAVGGVWGSGDAGLTWTQIGGGPTDPADNSDVPDWGAATAGCIWVSFGATAADDILVVGTGEAIPNSPYFAPENGMNPGGVGFIIAHGPLASPGLFARPWRREGALELNGAGCFRLIATPQTSATAPELFAATSAGLWRRTGALSDVVEWQRVELAPNTTGIVTDACWTTDTAGTPDRLWLGVLDGETAAVWHSDDGSVHSFTEVGLPPPPGEDPARSLRVAAADKQPSEVFVYRGTRKRIAALFRVDNADTTPGITALGNLPPLKPEPSRMALVVQHDSSSSKTTLLLGGMTTTEPDDEVLKPLGTTAAAVRKAAGLRLQDEDAALFRCEVSGALLSFTPANDTQAIVDPTWIGAGVHADVCEIVVDELGGVWVAGDGGVYRSDHGGDMGTFFSLNDGLATLESGYIAASSAHGHGTALGTQDNGTLVRTGDTVWTDIAGGDGGSVAFHPRRDSFHLFGQVYQGTYYSVAGETQTRLWGASHHDEDERGLWYSTLDVLAKPNSPEVAYIAFGNDNVWFCSHWWNADPTTWVSLPSGRDRDRRRTNQTPRFRDDRDPLSPVVSVRFVDPEHIVALRRHLAAAGGARVELLTKRDSGRRWGLERLDKPAGRRAKAVFAAGELTRFEGLPVTGTVSEMAVDEKVDASASLYISTSGGRGERPLAPLEDDPDDIATFAGQETLWWYDGRGHWYPTGLSSHPNGTRSPAFAVACGEAVAGGPREVFVGTGVGVYRGVRSHDPTDDPLTHAVTWTWEPFSVGLPERAVQDLAVVSEPSGRKLRAALPSQGAWEVDLDHAPQPRVYLRGHPRDRGRLAPADWEAMTNDPHAATSPPPGGSGEYVWTGSPDIALHPKFEQWTYPANDPAAATTSKDEKQDFDWKTQAMLYAHDPRFEVTGSFTEPRFRRELAKTQPLPDLRATRRPTPTEWTALEFMARGKLGKVWRTPTPTEADLALRMPRNERHPPGPKTVYVLVHSSHLAAPAGSSTSVVLLERTMPTQTNDPSVVLTADFRAFVPEALAGTATSAVGWSVVGSVETLVQEPDVRTPRSVEISGDLVMGSTPKLLLAVINPSADPFDPADKLANAASLYELVRDSRHLACRLVLPI